jgi:tRNA(adenine34) deaminase
MSFPLPLPMRRALDLAAEAAAAREVPVGAVVTLGDEIVAETRNGMRGSNDPTAHAEMEAIRAAAAKLGTPRLDDCTLWVTLEPCAMCAAAIGVARLKALRFGAEDPKGGGVVRGPRIFAQPTCHHRPDVLGGIGETESGELLRRFFAERRQLR